MGKDEKPLTPESLRALLDSQELISQRDQAEWLGVGQATVSRLLAGTQKIPKWLSVWAARIK